MVTTVTSIVNNTCVIFVQKESDFYGNISYTYSFGDSDTTQSGDTTVSHSYTRPGRYTAQVSLQNIAGSVSVTESVYIQGKQ